MSRGPTMEDLATLAKAFAEWICDKKHGAILEDAINAALLEYNTQRVNRKHLMGAPVPVEKEPSFYPTTSATVEAELPSMAMLAIQAVTAASSTVLNRFRFCTAYAAENMLTDREAEFHARFGPLSKENATLAFFDIGNGAGGWEVDGHGMVGRCSLKTLAVAHVLQVFMTALRRQLSLKPTQETDEMSALEICLAYYDVDTYNLRAIAGEAEKMYCRLTTTAHGQAAIARLSVYYDAKRREQPAANQDKLC